MLITIKVMNVRVLDDNGEDLGPHVMARGFMPSGQLLIDGRVRAGSAPSVKRDAVAEVAEWLQAHRPGWTVAIDLPDDDARDLATLPRGQEAGR